MKHVENELLAQNYKTTFHWLKKDFLLFEREHRFFPPHVETDVYGDFWMLWFCEIQGDEVAIARNGLQKLEAGRFVVLIPPFSIIEWHIHARVIDWQGYAWPSHPAWRRWRGVFGGAMLFHQCFTERPREPAQIFRTLEEEKPCMILQKEEGMETQALAIKDAIDRHFREELKIGDVARQLKLRNYGLTRCFKRAFGINPVAYLQKLRVSHAIHSLLFQNLENVSAAAFDCGFSDLSRFNKNFLKHSKSTPVQHMKMAQNRLGARK